MAQYIQKDALVAEIERKRNVCKKVVLDLRTEENKDYYQGKTEAYKEALDLLDTLEVKEVDLDKEEPTSDDLEKAAKHHLYSNILYDDVYVGNPTEEDCIEMFKAGAKWRKEQSKK